MIPLHVFPITDGRSRALHKVLDDIFFELDDTGADVVFWDDIGSPDIRGPAYENYVSDRQIEDDRSELAAYREGVSRFGNDADLYAWQEVEKLVQVLDLQNVPRPYLVVRGDGIGERILDVAQPSLLNARARDEVKRIICESVTKATLVSQLAKFASQPPVFAEGLEKHLDLVAAEIRRIAAGQRPDLGPGIQEIGGGLLRFPYLGDLICSEDARLVRVDGQTFRFGDRDKARFVECLLRESQLGPVRIRGSELLALAKVTGTTWWDLFKGDPALHTLIRPAGKSYVILGLPPCSTPEAKKTPAPA